MGCIAGLTVATELSPTADAGNRANNANHAAEPNIVGPLALLAGDRTELRAGDEQGRSGKNECMRGRQHLVQRRFDLSGHPSDVMMSAGRKAVQQGVRVMPPTEMTWQQLAEKPPAQIR